MHAKWEVDASTDEWSREVVVFWLRCNDCGGLVAEYVVRKNIGGILLGCSGSNLLDQLSKVGEWRRFDPDDYQQGLSNRRWEADGTLKASRICRHEWNGLNDTPQRVFKASDLRKGLKYLNDAQAHDLRILESLKKIKEKWDISELLDQLFLDSEWDERGIQIRLHPNSFDSRE